MVILISDLQGITETDFDSNSNKTGDTWSNAGGTCATDTYNLDGSSNTTNGPDDTYNGTATARDDLAIIDNYCTDNP